MNGTTKTTKTTKTQTRSRRGVVKTHTRPCLYAGMTTAAHGRCGC